MQICQFCKLSNFIQKILNITNFLRVLGWPERALPALVFRFQVFPGRHEAKKGVVEKGRDEGSWKNYFSPKFWRFEPILGFWCTIWKSSKFWKKYFCPSGHLGIDFGKIWKMGSMQNWNLWYSTVRNFDFGQFLIQFWQFCDFRVKD